MMKRIAAILGILLMIFTAMPVQAAAAGIGAGSETCRYGKEEGRTGIFNDSRLMSSYSANIFRYMGNGWHKRDGSWFYLRNGKALTGWIRDVGKWYFLGRDGKMKTNAGSRARTKGELVAQYALQFVGNPYVYGGNSLTKGTDCSGFVMLIYRHFGVSLPHYDAAIRTKGKSVASLREAKAGDIICYYGHVAIYLGDGRIVHASNSRDGIKISERADYRTIAGIRRIFD